MDGRCCQEYVEQLACRHNASSVTLPHLVLCDVVVDLGVGQRSPLVREMIIHPCATHPRIAIGLRLLRRRLARHARCVKPRKIQFSDHWDIMVAVHEGFCSKSVFECDDLCVRAIRMRFDGLELANSLYLPDQSPSPCY